jgi:hypothetical protein
MPSCPEPSCDNRLILACVTVQNGQIMDICHFGSGRQQVVTFPVLYYWLSYFGIDAKLDVFINNLQRTCCGEADQGNRTFGDTELLDPRTNLAQLASNPANVNRFVNAAMAQNLGATIVNAVSKAATAVDLRPLVGQPKDVVTRALDSHNIGAAQNAKLTGTGSAITWSDVSTDPAWNDAAVASSARFAPAAFNSALPLTVFTKGNLVVGFEVTDPTDILNTKVANLQAQVAQLTELVNRLQPQAAAVPAQPAANPPPPN